MLIKPNSVKDSDVFVDYLQQELGLPSDRREANSTKKAVQEFFEQYPYATYSTLVNLVQWAKFSGTKYSRGAALLRYGTPYAYEKGYLPELDPSYDIIERISYGS